MSSKLILLLLISDVNKRLKTRPRSRPQPKQKKIWRKSDNNIKNCNCNAHLCVFIHTNYTIHAFSCFTQSVRSEVHNEFSLLHLRKTRADKRLSVMRARCGLIINPLREKTFSTGAELAGEHNTRSNSLPNVENSGILTTCGSVLSVGKDDEFMRSM